LLNWCMGKLNADGANPLFKEIEGALRHVAAETLDTQR
jgi:hypothetical protein